MKKCVFALVCALVFCAFAGNGDADRTMLWPEGKMPHAQPQQKYAPCLQWYVPPHKPNGACVILISGGGYNSLTDGALLNRWNAKLSERGFQCVSLKYRTPPTKGASLPGYQAAWDDGQRAVRVVRREAAARGFDPNKIGAMGMSAGAHLTALLAVNATTNAYARIDALDDTPCNVNFAITGAIAYGLRDERRGATSLDLCDYWLFDKFTPPMCLLHGAEDGYSPRHSVAFDKALKAKGLYAELHLFPGRPHGFWGDENKPRAEREPHDRWWEIVEAFLVRQGLCKPGADDPQPPVAATDATPEALTVTADTTLDERRPYAKGRIDFKAGTLSFKGLAQWPCGAFVYLLGGKELVMDGCRFERKARSICSGGKPFAWTAKDTVCKLGLYGNQIGRDARLRFVDSDMEICCDAPNCGGEVVLENTRLVLSGGQTKPLENFTSFALAGRFAQLHADVSLTPQKSFSFDVPKGGYAVPAPVCVRRSLTLPEGFAVGVDATKLAKGTYPLIRAGDLRLPAGGVDALAFKAKCAAGRSAKLVCEGETLSLLVR